MTFVRQLNARLCSPRPLLTAITFTALVAHAATVPPPDKLLASDTLAMVTAPDFAKLCETYAQSPQAQFWNDPAMKAFKDKFVAKLNEEIVTPLERELNVKFSDYTNMIQGQLTLAANQNGWPDADKARPALLLLADVKDNSARLSKQLADVKKKWVDAGKTLRTEKIRDIEFAVLVVSGKDMPKSLQKIIAPEPQFADVPGEDAESTSEDSEQKKPESKSDLYIGQSESLLIVGTAAKPIERLLARMAGGTAPILGELPAFEANRGVFRDAPAYGWVNIKTIVDALLSESSESDSQAEENPLALDPKKVVSALGLTGLRSLALGMQNTREGSMFQFFLNVPETSRTGLIKLMAGEDKDTSVPPFVPADTAKFQRWRLDSQKAWATLESMLKQISPQFGGMLDFLLSQASAAAREKDPDFDLKQQLIGSLGDDYIMFEKKPGTGSWREYESPPSLTLIGTPKPEQLVVALKTLLLLAPQPSGGGPNEREFLGRKIYSVDLTRLPMAGGPSVNSPRILHFTATSSYVALSTDTAMLEEFVRSSDQPGKPLRETSGLSDATPKVVGAGTSWFTYENQADGMRALLELVKKDAAGATNANVLPTMPGGLANIRDWFDVTLLPPYDKVSKYFYFTVSSLSANADGLSFKIFAPTPPQMR